MKAKTVKTPVNNTKSGNGSSAKAKDSNKQEAKWPNSKAQGKESDNASSKASEVKISEKNDSKDDK